KPLLIDVCLCMAVVCGIALVYSATVFGCFTGRAGVHACVCVSVCECVCVCVCVSPLLTSPNLLCFGPQGAFTFRGSMIDMPSLKQAQNIVTLASAVQRE